MGVPPSSLSQIPIYQGARNIGHTVELSKFNPTESTSRKEGHPVTYLDINTIIPQVRRLVDSGGGRASGGRDGTEGERGGREWACPPAGDFLWRRKLSSFLPSFAPAAAPPQFG